MSDKIHNRLLLAAGAALALALPSFAQAQAGGQDYPMCSATVTDHCMQREGGSHARAHHSKHAKHHRMAHKHKS